MGIILHIALPVPLRQLFDYLPPKNVPEKILQKGMRVLVPFGKQQKVGVIHALSAQSTIDPKRLKYIEKILDKYPTFSQSLLKLIQWASTYYMHPIGQTLFIALPKNLRQPIESQWPTQTQWALNPNQSFQVEDFKQAPKQLALIQYLKNYIQASCKTLNQLGFSKSIRGKLLEQNYLCTTKEQVDLKKLFEYKNIHPTQELGLTLNTDQQNAIKAITNSFETFRTFLLEGITGSGKTEVYLHCIEKALLLKKQVLVLVPEIGLTPQMLNRFKQHFNASVICLHSKLSNQQRFHAHLLAHSGKANIFIGTRLSSFLSLKNPGLFIVDESHDLSFKQQDSIRYSARNMLIMRAAIEQCPVVLGSATPSLETIFNAQQKKYDTLKLTNRTGKAVLPCLSILDVRHKKLQEGLSTKLIEKIKIHLDKKEQVLLFLNRRGFSPVFMCVSCNFIFTCVQCDANLTFHSTHFHLRCHYCEKTTPLPKYCKTCSSNTLAPIGLGTQRLEQTLTRLFPNAKIARIDKDSTKNKNALKNHLDKIYSGESNILIGTQMLAKGHHFPNLTLVAILDCDNAFFSSDFRAMEHMGQLITQVAGRAGRCEKPGFVFLQTAQPEHPLLKTLISKGYFAFVQCLLEERKQAALPPYSHQILIRAKAKKHNQALVFLKQIRSLIQQIPSNFRVLGPTSAPMEKREGHYRAQLLFQSSCRKTLQTTTAKLIENITQLKLGQGLQWSVDVDPVDLF